MSNSRLLRLVGGITVVVAVALLSGGALLVRQSYRLVDAASQTEGKVTQLVEQPYWDRKVNRRTILYRPLVEYQVNGATYTFESKTGSNPAAYTAGERVTVLFPRDNPAAGSLGGFLALWFLPTVLFGLGGVFGSVGVFWLVLSSRKRRMSRAV